MHRNVTAVYRTREAAELVRSGLEDIGIPARDIHIVPDPAHDTSAGRAAETGHTGTVAGAGAGAAPRGTTTAAGDPAGIGGSAPGGGTGVPAHPSAGRDHTLKGAGYGEAGHRDDPAHTDRLHELHLPDEDVREYQHCVRNGDYVVSAEVDDPQLDKVKEVMRRPESAVHDIEHRSSEFRNESLIAHSAGEGHMRNEDMRARRLAAGDDRHYRTYERDRRLDRQTR